MRQSHLVNGLRLLRLWHRRRQIARSHGIGEVLALVRAVAEGLVAGMAAAAQGDGRSSSKAERVAFLIFNFKIAFYSDRAVIKNRHFSCWQGNLR